MELQVNRWGNSLAMRLPAALVRDLELEEGSRVSTRELGQKLLSIDSAQGAQQLAARKQWIADIRALHKTMPVTQPIAKEDLSRY